jgi:nucleoside 2-deoxyribosyltransferase
MKVYLAARYSRKKEIKSLVPLLAENNIKTTSKWLDETGSDTAHLDEFTPSFCQATAYIDLADIEEADAFVFFAEDPKVGTPRGGRHVEFGYALARGKRMIVIGGQENIFHYLPEIVHYQTVQDFLDAEGIENVVAQ